MRSGRFPAVAGSCVPMQSIACSLPSNEASKVSSTDLLRVALKIGKATAAKLTGLGKPRLIRLYRFPAVYRYLGSVSS